MKRREFLHAGPTAAALAGASAVAAQATEPSFEWHEASAADLSRAMAEGRTTSAALVRAYQARIAAVDQAGPMLASMLELNLQAEAIAAQCDAERAAGRARGPLHGIPVVIKDNIATADGMATSAGSPA